MKKILVMILPLLMALACTKDISRFNDETKRAAVVPAGTLFANATRNLADNLASASVNTNPFRFVVKHWAMTTYQDELQFNFSTRNIPQTWWTNLYRDVLIDYKDAARIISGDVKEDDQPIAKANKLAIIDMMQIYTFSNLVTTFGDIPYTDALDSKNLFPVYDDAKTVYTDLLGRLTIDVGTLNASTGSFSSSEDLIYKGDVTKWIRFGNTLRVRMAMLLTDADAGMAQSNVEAADANAFTTADDNAIFNYLSATPNTNPLYADIIIGNRGDYVAARDLMDPMLDLNDPRVPHFFGTNSNGDYVGGVSGTGNTYAAFSKPGDQVSTAAAPQYILDYVETEFYRAEAIERGYSLAGTAEQHYNNAIRASILQWGGSDADADAYLAQTEVAYATATGDWKQKIGFQKWIAMYNRPQEGWTEIRRLDQPVLTLPIGAQSGFPVRYTYPNNEQQLNPSNYKAAAAKIGGDEVETKLFWDIN